MEIPNPEDFIENGNLEKGVELDDTTDDSASSSTNNDINEIDESLNTLEVDSNHTLNTIEMELDSEANALEAKMLTDDLLSDDNSKEIDNLDEILSQEESTYNSLDDFDEGNEEYLAGADGFNMNFQIDDDGDNLDMNFEVDDDSSENSDLDHDFDDLDILA